MSEPRPGPIPVILAALCAAGMVTSFALGHFNATWAFWLALFLVVELWSAVNHALGDTFSERVWRWIGINPQRPSRWGRILAVGVFMVELTAHFVSGGQTPLTGSVAIVVAATPVAGVICWSLVFEGRSL